MPSKRRSGLSSTSSGHNDPSSSTSRSLPASSPPSSTPMTSSPPVADSRSSLTSKAAGTLGSTYTASGQDATSLPASTVRARKKGAGIEKVLAAGSQKEQGKRGGKGKGAVAVGDKVPSAQVDGPANDDDDTDTMPTLPPAQTVDPKWVLLALLSGGFAAMNGVFAKLTTSSDEPPFTSFFTSLFSSVSPLVIQGVLRAIFFGLNLASNAIMWVLFTRALTSHPSTTKVSVVNTSANFALTAVMGALVFRESLGGLGGVAGLALLVGGCVILGAKKDKDGAGEDAAGAGPGALGADAPIVDAEAAELVAGAYSDDVEVESEVDLIDLEDAMKSEYDDPGAILDGTETESEVEI